MNRLFHWKFDDDAVCSPKKITNSIGKVLPKFNIDDDDSTDVVVLDKTDAHLP